MAEESDREFCWLFLENACGQEYSTGNAEHRAVAARWLSAIHQAAVNAGLEAQLPSREPGRYLELLRAARCILTSHLANPELRTDDLRVLRTLTAHCDALEGRWHELEERCQGIPRTL